MERGSERDPDRRPPRQRVPWAQKTPRERGIALVWMSLTLLVMLTFAGFAIDISNWYLQAEKAQRAADAAAHAGVVFLPGDVTNAKLIARREAAKNNYNDGIVAGVANATVTPTQEANPNRLRVKVTTDVPSFFAQLVGLDEITISREAVAEYIAPVPMGSPENKLGNDPDNGYSPNLWVILGGPNSYKGWGDRYGAKTCESGTAKCTGTSNPEYLSDGYFFTANVKSAVSGQPLRFDAFDPIYAGVQSSCSNLPSSSDRTTLQTLPGNPYPDATTRYAGGTSSPYCTGDMPHEGANVETTFIVRSPDHTPWTDTDNPVVNTSTCQPTTFEGYNITSGTQVFQLLHPTDGYQDSEAVINASDGVTTFAEAFRKWVTVCEIPSGSVQTGEYLLQVRTNVTAADPTNYDPSISTGGHNRMSLRVGFGSSGVSTLSGTNVTLSARGRLPVFVNLPGATANFYLARVLPYDAGRTLRITFFDMGDSSSSGYGTLQVLPPTEYATTFSGCAFERDDGASLSQTGSVCRLNNITQSSYNRRLTTVDVPIPDDYTCSESSATGCWIRVKMDWSSGSPTDVTTWSASILGNPVRLVE